MTTTSPEKTPQNCHKAMQLGSAQLKAHVTPVLWVPGGSGALTHTPVLIYTPRGQDHF